MIEFRDEALRLYSADGNRIDADDLGQEDFIF